MKNILERIVAVLIVLCVFIVVLVAYAFGIAIAIAPYVAVVLASVWLLKYFGLIH